LKSLKYNQTVVSIHPGLNQVLINKNNLSDDLKILLQE